MDEALENKDYDSQPISVRAERVKKIVYWFLIADEEGRRQVLRHAGRLSDNLLVDVKRELESMRDLALPE